jgi:hypothetical protein
MLVASATLDYTSRDSLRLYLEELCIGLLLHRGFLSLDTVSGAIDTEPFKLLVFGGAFGLVLCLGHFRICCGVDLFENVHLVVVGFAGDGDGVDHLCEEVVAKFVVFAG